MSEVQCSTTHLLKKRKTISLKNIQQEPVFRYDSTTGVFTIPPGGDEVTTSLLILFISSYDSTTGVFTVPPGGDGVYVFSTFLLGSHSEDATFDIKLNDDVICSTLPDSGNNGDLDYPSGSCGAIVNAVAGKLI